MSQDPRPQSAAFDDLAPKIPAAPRPADPLGVGAPGGGRRGRRLVLLALILALTGGAAWYLFIMPAETKGPRWETVQVERGDLTVTVAATGTLQPADNQVVVGSELSGIIESVLVEDNSLVKRGQALARLDMTKLENQVANSRAALEVAEANVLLAEATRTEASATLSRDREVFKLSGGKVPSKTELETAVAALARAKASLIGAKASVTQARATLRTDETNLAKATLRSPIDGIVLIRSVEPGQTVAASLQAPVLFTLAKDLSRMDLQLQVDEADVGQVRVGQHTVFTVDAYPNRSFPAVITRVRFGPTTTTDNVVTYLTVLEVQNADLSLRPGMTASAQITVSNLHDVLLVPNAALRFTPPREKKEAQLSLVARLIPRPPRQEKKVREPGDKGKSGRHKIWILRDGQATPVKITPGLSDGQRTEILAGDLKPGMEAIIGTLASHP